MNGFIRNLLVALIVIAPMSARAVDSVAVEGGWEHALAEAWKSVRAVDGVAIEGGWQDDNRRADNASRGGGALVWDWGVKWLPVGGWYLGGQWELSASYWDGDKGKTGNGSLGDFGITPVFRIQTDAPLLGIYPFVEGAIGAHLFTNTTLGDRRFGILYSFGDSLGGGIRFGDKGQYEINYRFQHLSHLVGSPNNGINFQLIRFGYRW